MAPKATAAQKEEMFHWACKEMLILSGEHAIRQTETMQIKAPVQEVGKFEEFIAELRKAGTGLRDKFNAGASAGEEKKEEKSSGIMGKMAGLASSAAAMAADGIGAVSEKAILGLADAMTAALDSLHKSFSGVASQVALDKREKIIEIYMTNIHGEQIANPVQHVRGVLPHGPDQHRQVDAQALSRFFMAKPGVKGKLEQQMMEIVAAEVEKCTATRAWKTLIDTYNSTNEKLGGLGDLGKALQGKPIQLDIEKYIVEQIVLETGRLMGVKEAELRNKPESVKKPMTFALCYGPLADAAYVNYDAIAETSYRVFLQET